MSKWYSLCYLLIFLKFLEVNTHYCERLYEVYNTNSSSNKATQRYVRINKQIYEVIVAGGGGAARATAALLLAVLRSRLSYAARLDLTRDICQLMDIPVVVAPAAIFHKGCGNGDRNINKVASFSKPAIVSIEINFMAHVSPTSNCKIDSSWIFLKYANVSTCGFLTTDNYNFNASKGRISKDCNPPCVVVLARNESSFDSQIIQEFENRARANKLNIAVITFDSDTSFRREIFQHNSTKSYLFLDEKILWTKESDVLELGTPPCPKSDSHCSTGYNIFGDINVIRVGDGYIIKDYAPPIYELMNKFSPKPEYIRDILLHEAHSNEHDIEESACSWALDHRNEFEYLYEKKERIPPPEFYINLILCKNDPYIEQYKEVCDIVNLEFLWNDIKELDYTINFNLVDCIDVHAFKNALSFKSIKMAGSVTFSWYPGLAGGSNAATYTQIPLMLAGPANDIILGKSTYTTSGKISDLAKAYRFFLSQCAWSRVAIISDHSEYSNVFAEAIVSEKNLNYVQVIVNQSTISLELSEMKYRDARIFIINTDCQTADEVLSEAAKLLSPLSDYVWIVRDWCLVENRTKIEGLIHFTIDFSWRGGKVLGGSNNLRLNLSRNHNLATRNITISPGISYLADALLQLGHGFAAYRRQDISRRYDLHGFGTARDYNEALNATNITGLAQNIIMDNYSLLEPFVYVEKWHGNEKHSVAVWKLVKDRVVSVWSAVNDTNSCYSILSSKRVSDGNKCIVYSGNDFKPRCHDDVILILIVVILFIIIAIYLAQRMRKKRLLAENRTLVAKLLESRQEKASALIEFLVDRDSIRLLHEIGSGCYGRVRFAELTRPGRGTLVVAAKEPHEGVLSMAEENEILREACVLARLEHNNVIRLMGVCLANGPPIVLMEHAIYSDLLRYLTERRHLIMKIDYDKETDHEVSDESLTQLARDAASALEYLAERRLVHRDIRAANCLIDKKRSLKLADFGMARELGETESTYMTCRRGLFPVLWMSPESLSHGVFSLSSDIWATGVLLLEIATIGARPYGDWPKCRVVCHVIDGGRPPLPPDTSMQMRKLLQRCWHFDPEKRITAIKLREYLNEYPKAISAALLSPEPPLTPHEADIKFLT